MSDLTRCIIFIFLLILSAYFSMSESSFSYVNQIKLKVRADEKSKSAKRVLAALEKFDKYIVTILICNNIVNILATVMATVLCVNFLRNNASPASAEEYGVIISTILTTIIIFMFGEVIPKALAKARPESAACFCIYPIWIISIILTPISLVFNGLIKIMKKIFKTRDDEPLISEDDFQEIVENIEQDGQIESEESEIIQSAVDFDDLKVKEVMCPKEKICSLNINSKLSREELIDFIGSNNYSRIPVYDGNIDNIIGILHMRNLLKALMSNADYNLKDLLLEPLFVKPNVHLDTIFEEFKKRKTHLAIVTDKDNHTLGIVTMEDVLEELVGDIDESNEGGVKHE